MPNRAFKVCPMMLLLAIAVAVSPNELGLPPRPRQPLAALISPMDYPPTAVAAREQGKVAMSLSINEVGRTADCRITASSGSALLDRASCSIIARRARFHPAVDADGKPVAGRYEHQIDWVLP